MAQPDQNQPQQYAESVLEAQVSARAEKAARAKQPRPKPQSVDLAITIRICSHDPSGISAEKRLKVAIKELSETYGIEVVGPIRSADSKSPTAVNNILRC